MPNSYWSTTLIFIRHAQARAADGSYGNDTLLSPFGHEQAQALVAAFTSETVPTVVYTSPYPRAVATAQPLCYHYGITPIVDVRLAEFALPAGSLATVQQRPDLVLWQPDHCGVRDGETLAAFAARVADLCTTIALQHAHTSVAMVTHSGVIDAALRWAVGLATDSLWQHDFELATASVTEIEVWPYGRVSNGAPRYCAIRRVGDVRHLGQLISDL
jgi:broad specificity phosphatase PhoE